MTPDARNAVNRALNEVATLMDVVVIACSWCLRVAAVEPSATWGQPGVSHGLCARCQARMEEHDAA